MIAALRVTVGTGEKSADGTRLKSRLGDFCNWVRTSRGVFLTQVCWSAAVWGGKEKKKKNMPQSFFIWNSVCYGLRLTVALVLFLFEKLLVLSCCCFLFFSK